MENRIIVLSHERQTTDCRRKMPLRAAQKQGLFVPLDVLSHQMFFWMVYP